MSKSTQRILVKTPLTTNGSDPVMGSDGRQVFSESVLMASARPVLEKRNESLPKHLQVIIENYDGDGSVKAADDDTAQKEITDKLAAKAQQDAADKAELEALRKEKAAGQLGAKSTQQKTANANT